MNCLNCESEIKERISNFCSTECKNAWTRKNAPETWGIKK